ncbi:MAG: NADH-quinone oxidoreductase subunit NuoN [Cucumibacter sp.]
MLAEMLTFNGLAPAFPELALLAGAIVLLMAGAFSRGGAASLIMGVAIGLLVAVALLEAITPIGASLFAGGFVQDEFARFMKILVLTGSALALVLSVSAATEHALNKFEYSVLVLLATLGMLMMISAGDLIALYVGLEMQSLALYVVAAMKRDSARATEAGLKYFVLGALSSGMLLYGASLIYGFTGQTRLDEITRIIAFGDNSIGLIFGLVFLLAGLAFKISAVPFHMWTPDVYEGAPTPVTAFFAAAPKVAAMALFVRLTYGTFAPIGQQWQQIVIFLSIASMSLAAFAAIGQSNVKRLIAYSSIGHVGFALVGLSAGSEIGVQGVAIYMAIYMVMTIGLFACVLSLRSDNAYVEAIGDLAGLSQNRPFIAAIMSVFLFSLIGLPPLAGFFAKWHVFLAAVEANLYGLAVIGVLMSAVSAFYYLKIVRTMYFDEPTRQFEAAPGELRLVMIVSGILVVTYYLTVGSWLAPLAKSAAGSLV